MAPIRQIRRSHYRLLGRVGHGQFGQVYCAIHRKTGSLVALKDLHRDRFPTHKFLRELRFLLSLEHPNIVTCHALEHSTNGRQLVLDYCEGGTLRSILDSDLGLTLEEALSFVLDILAGLDHAHQQGIVHCDIKPENILLQLTPGGWMARISDFGIARLSQEVQKSEIGHTGSPAYMAPERFYNQHSSTSDLYAVGIILYELLLGCRPFSGTPMELMVAHLNQAPKIPDALPEALQKITGTALQKLLPKRFQSADEMRRAVLQIYQQVQTGQLAAYPIRTRPLPDPVAAPPLPALPIPHAIEVMGLARLPSPAAPPSTQGRAGLLMVASQQQVWFYHWPSQGEIAPPPSASQGFTLPAPVRQFVAIPQGGVLITPKSLHLLSMTHGLGRIAQEPDPMEAAISPNGQWFATCSLVPSTWVEIRIRHVTSQPDVPIKISSACRVPIAIGESHRVALLPLDHRHLALVVRQRQQTHFHLVTRRGQYLGPISVSVPMASLVATPHPYRYLGLEVSAPESLLIIDFKPFRLVRYRLDMAPQWIFATASGYGGLDGHGQLSLMNEQGQITHRATQLPCPTALLQLSASQFLWSTPDHQGSLLYTVDLAGMEDYSGV